jgi:hypothetical protein
VLENFDARQLTAISEFLARTTDLLYRHAALLRAETISDLGRARVVGRAPSPDGTMRNQGLQPGATALGARLSHPGGVAQNAAAGSCGKDRGGTDECYARTQNAEKVLLSMDQKWSADHWLVEVLSCSCPAAAVRSLSCPQ